MNLLGDLIHRYPVLIDVKEEILDAYEMLENCFCNNGKLLVAGNGGSAADSEHIAGELMKSFKKARPIEESFARKMIDIDETRGSILAKNLERCLTTIPLVAHEALITAYINDVDSLGVFAQQLYGLGRKGDVFLAISTSGNSENIINAAVVAKAMGIHIIGLTGEYGGELAKISDVVVRVPERESYLIQELHLPIYHYWCMMLEEHFFDEKNGKE